MDDGDNPNVLELHSVKDQVVAIDTAADIQFAETFIDRKGERCFPDRGSLASDLSGKGTSAIFVVVRDVSRDIFELGKNFCREDNLH